MKFTILKDPPQLINIIYSVCRICDQELRSRFLFLKNAFSLRLTWTRPSTRTPTRGFMKVTIHHYNILILSDLCPGEEKKILKKTTNITDFTHKLPPIWLGGHEIYSFSSPNPIDLIEYNPVDVYARSRTNANPQQQVIE